MVRMRVWNAVRATIDPMRSLPDPGGPVDGKVWSGAWSGAEYRVKGRMGIDVYERLAESLDVEAGELFDVWNTMESRVWQR